jgi:hypothetical protein
MTRLVGVVDMYTLPFFLLAVVALTVVGTVAAGAIGRWQVSVVLLFVAVFAHALSVRYTRRAISDAAIIRYGGPGSRVVHKRIPDWVNGFVSVALAAIVSAVAIWFF